MIESDGEYISGTVSSRNTEQIGRNLQVTLKIELDEGIGQHGIFVLAPNLHNLNIGLRSHIQARHKQKMIYEILSVDGKPLSQQHLTPKLKANIPMSVTIASGMQIILGPLLILNAFFNGSYTTLALMVLFALAHIGTGYWMYTSVTTAAAMGAFIVNLVSLMAWIIGPYNYTGALGAMIGLSTILLQSILTGYFVCPPSMKAYQR